MSFSGEKKGQSLPPAERRTVTAKPLTFLRTVQVGCVFAHSLSQLNGVHTRSASPCTALVAAGSSGRGGSVAADD
eukprot:g64665.t1